jgi:hypothetical protein
MARLKDLESGAVAERRYVAKRFVYLESEEDVQILGDRWFSDRGHLSGSAITHWMRAVSRGGG